MKKWVKQNHRFFLFSFNSKLSHFDKDLDLNLNLHHKWFSSIWRYDFDLQVIQNEHTNYYNSCREHSENIKKMKKKFPSFN
jgi:hypothetical protein